MKNNCATKTAVLVAILALAGELQAGEDKSTAHWIRETPEDTPNIPGEVVKTKKDMEARLKECKWKGGYPKVDWSTHCVAVVSPEKFEKNGDLQFCGLIHLKRRPVPGKPTPKPTLRLLYGWKPIPRTDTREVMPDGTMVITSGSSRPGMHATLVVAFKRSILEEGPLEFQNLGLLKK
jgi:hypothetical protein